MIRIAVGRYEVTFRGCFRLQRLRHYVEIIIANDVQCRREATFFERLRHAPTAASEVVGLGTYSGSSQIGSAPALRLQLQILKFVILTSEKANY